MIDQQMVRETLRQNAPEVQDDLLSRGYSRRNLGRIVALFGAGMAVANWGRPAWAAAGVPDPAPTAKTRIGSNECWTGPLKPGQDAAHALVAQSNRYAPHDERGDFIKAVMAVEKVPYDHVAPWPGSSDPLCRTIVTYCSPTRGLVTANPTFELGWRTAAWLGAPVKRVPLTKDYAHDVKAMLAADPNAGLYYICTPNNPTGTVTPIADIEWLLANKPADSMVLIDEAYLHFSDASPAAYLAAQRKDVIVMRTFSKLFGMAGMRLGYVMTNPANVEKMMRYDGGMQSGALPLPTLACGTASLTAAGLIAARKKEMVDAREMTLAHLRKKGIAFHPTHSNMIMVDWKGTPAKAMQEAFRKQDVEIGRSWEIWPTVSRITVGSMTDMSNFCGALDKIIA